MTTIQRRRFVVLPRNRNNKNPADDDVIEEDDEFQDFERIVRVRATDANGVLSEVRVAGAEHPGTADLVFLLKWSLVVDDVLGAFGDDDQVWEQLGKDVCRQKTRFDAGDGAVQTVGSTDALRAALSSNGLPGEHHATVGALCTQAALALPWAMLMATAPEGYAPAMSEIGACGANTAKVKVIAGDTSGTRPTCVVLRKRFVLRNPEPAFGEPPASPSASSWTTGDHSESESCESATSPPSESSSGEQSGSCRSAEPAETASVASAASEPEDDWSEEAVVRVYIEPFRPRTDVVVWVQWLQHHVARKL